MYKELLFMLSLIFALPLSAQDIKLNSPNKKGGKPLMQALSERKSTREFQDKELSINVLSDLLWAANGFNRPANRTVPTANDRQEIELYVTENEKSMMKKNVLEHEPHTALFVPDNDPLKFYKYIAEFAINHLNPNGKIYLEINRAYAVEISTLFRQYGFCKILIKKDLNSNDRFAEIAF